MEVQPSAFATLRLFGRSSWARGGLRLGASLPLIPYPGGDGPEG